MATIWMSAWSIPSV